MSPDPVREPPVPAKTPDSVCDAGADSMSRHSPTALNLPETLSCTDCILSGFEALMHAYPAPVHPAEILAFSMLHERTLVRSKIVEMVDLLPFEPSPRAETGRAFAAGAYGQGALVGFRKNTLVFPFCVLP